MGQKRYKKKIVATYTQYKTRNMYNMETQKIQSFDVFLLLSSLRHRSRFLTATHEMFQHGSFLCKLS